MASAEKRRHHRWRKSAGRLLRCSCCLPCERRDPAREQEMKINGGPQRPHWDQRGSGETEAVQITVEDLGIVNTGFSLLDEDPLTPQGSGGVARSASSVSVCPRALQKKRGLKPLSTLPTQPQPEAAIAAAGGEEEAEEEEEEENNPLLYNGRSLLQSPVIHLIPPTPSDLADDDQFFDMNSEESVALTSGSDASFVTGDQEKMEECEEAEESEEGPREEEDGEKEEGVSPGKPAEPEDDPSDPLVTGKEAESTTGRPKPRSLRSIYQVAPLPEPPQRRTYNTGINLLSFTEHNLDELRDVSYSDVLLPANMDAVTHQRKALVQRCSAGERLTRSATFHAFTHTAQQEAETVEKEVEEESPRQRRRVTIPSYLPVSRDQNGNFPEKDVDGPVAKCLRELNTEEICQWFTHIGLEKCLPFIKDAKLHGADLASVDVNTLDVLHVTGPEDREQLLSAIYNELHPPTTIIQRLDSLLESSGPSNVETFTKTLASMSKSKSAPHVSCLSMNRRSLKLRNGSQNNSVQRNSQLIEVTINASERIVHLRTPKETTVGKVMDSCIKMLGVSEDKSLFALKEKPGSSEELPIDRHIGSLLTSENRQLELHLCKMEKAATPASQSSPNGSSENGDINQNIQPAKEERIKELNQQVDSLQNVIFQVQELHHGLVAFCSELKNMEGEVVNVDRLGSAELKQRLESLKSRLNNKRQSLQNLRDNINNAAALKKKQLEVRLLEKMKLNCQVFKEEISLVHLNRQVAHLQNALQESKVNGVPVLNFTQEELTDLLQQGPSAQVVVLRQPPPPTLTCQQSRVDPSPVQTVCPQSDAVAMETPPRRKVMAI